MQNFYMNDYNGRLVEQIQILFFFITKLIMNKIIYTKTSIISIYFLGIFFTIFAIIGINIYIFNIIGIYHILGDETFFSNINSINKSLKLNNITIKFRTNNAIGNYNRRFKELKGMEPNMPAGIFINNIIDDIQNHIDHIRKIEDKEEFK